MGEGGGSMHSCWFYSSVFLNLVLYVFLVSVVPQRRHDHQHREPSVQASVSHPVWGAEEVAA